MAAVAAYHDLLFGMLALQNGLINQGQLVAAFQAWTLDKARALADHLIGRGDLDSDDRSAVDALVARHIKKHGGDVERSLAAIPAGRSTRESLARIGDPDVGGTLAHLGSASTRHGDDADRTASYAVGEATSDGQRFRVLRPHARGGLGAVFVALDTELHREVALKQILESHADDPVSRQRFLLEAEVTGGLEHPGIVPVYGLGTYGDGRPYYAMRFIRGDSLKEAIERFHADPTLKNDPGRRSLELRKLLRRFTDVCNAIDYAHSRGVLHRDIKPGNVIVGRHGETLVVDWGLAKATGKSEPGSGERTLLPSSSSGSAETLPGSALGTPAYMSPEQAEGDLEHLGSRSDVYSLGATLYSLLTGKPPFEGDDIGAILRAVGKGEFPSPRSVDPSIDRALEAVCLKAMSVEAKDRYATPKALADDVERWAADEPVTAWREPPARRARRWGRRHRTAVTASVVALVAGTVGLSAVLVVQTRANAELTRSKAAVQARYDLAVEAIKTFHTGVSEDFLLEQEQFKALRDRLLKSASDFYGKLGALHGRETDLDSGRALAQSNFELAELTGKVGRKEDALASHQSVLRAREAMARDPKAGPETTIDVARSLTAIALIQRQIGKTDESATSYRKAMTRLDEPGVSRAAESRALLADCHAGLGELLSNEGDRAEAEAEYRQAVATARTLVDDYPGVVEYVGRLAESRLYLAGGLWRGGNSLEAEAEYRRAMALYRSLVNVHPDLVVFRKRLAECHAALGKLRTFTGTTEEADVELREALKIRQRLSDDYPAVTEFRSSLAWDHIDRVSNLRRPAEIEAEYRKALTLFGRLVDDHPTVTEFREGLAGTHHNLAGTLSQAGRLAEVEFEYRQAMTHYKKLADDDPDVTRYRTFEVGGHMLLGDILFEMARPAEAEAEFRQAITLFQKLADDHPGDAKLRLNAADCRHALGKGFLRVGKEVEAEAECRQALAITQELSVSHPAVTDFQEALAFSHEGLGWVLSQRGKPAEAVAEYRSALTIHRKVADNHPGEYLFACRLVDNHLTLASLLGRMARPAEAEAGVRQAQAITQKLVDDHPGAAYFRSKLTETHDALGRLLLQVGKLTEAEAEFDQALAIQKKLLDDNPTIPQYASDLAHSLTKVGRLLQAAGRRAKSVHAFRQAVASMEGLPHPASGELYNLACYQALLAGVTDGRAEGDRAMDTLRRAVAAGFRNRGHMQTDTDLDPLRDREDFRLLMLDLAMPADALAPAR